MLKLNTTPHIRKFFHDSVRWHFIAFITIFLFGSFLRLYNLEHKTRFIWDEGRDMLAIRHMLVEKDLTLFGPYNEIDGTKDFFGVFHYYLMAPWLYLADYDPLGPALFTAFLGIVSMPMFYFLCNILIGKRLLIFSLLATTIFSLSPVVVRHVQWAWNPNTTPFFSLLFVWSVTRAIETRKWKWNFLSGLLLGLLFQLHYFTFPLVIIWVGGMIGRKNRFWFSHLLLFIVGFLLPNLSFVIFDVTHEFFYWNIIKETLSNSGKQALITGNLFSVLASPIIVTVNAYTSFLGQSKFLGIISAGLFFSVTISALKGIKPKQSLLLIPLIFSWILFCLLAGLAPPLVDDYYYLPFSLILFSILVISLERIFPKKYMQFFALTLCLLLGIYLVIQNKPLRASTWQEQLSSVRYIGEQIARDANHEKFNVASLVDPDTRAMRFRYFIETSGAKPLSMYDYDQAETLYVITGDIEAEYRHNPAWELNTFKPYSEKFIAEHGPYKVYRIDKGSE